MPVAKITVMRGSGKIGEFPMKKSPFVVGREAKGGVLIENVGVSRKHCQFTYSGASEARGTECKLGL